MMGRHLMAFQGELLWSVFVRRPSNMHKLFSLNDISSWTTGPYFI